MYHAELKRTQASEKNEPDVCTRRGLLAGDVVADRELGLPISEALNFANELPTGPGTNDRRIMTDNILDACEHPCNMLPSPQRNSIREFQARWTLLYLRANL